MKAPRFILPDRDICLAEMPVVAVDIGTTVRPGRVRNRTKTEPDEKVKKPADGGVRKKSPPARKAPPRGRYVDEYARSADWERNAHLNAISVVCVPSACPQHLSRIKIPRFSPNSHENKWGHPLA